MQFKKKQVLLIQKKEGSWCFRRLEVAATYQRSIGLNQSSCSKLQVITFNALQIYCNNKLPFQNFFLTLTKAILHFFCISAT